MVGSLGLWLAGALAVFSLAVLRRRRVDEGPEQPREPQRDRSMEPTQPAPARPVDERLGCPVCRSEFPSSNRFCIKDGAELTPETRDQRLPQGAICPTCRRVHPADTDYCPLDGDELVPYGLYGAARATSVPEWPSTSKICPRCGDRCSTSRQQFCGRDGSPMVALN